MADSLKLRTASESVGWINSVGPLDVAPVFNTRPASPWLTTEQAAQYLSYSVQTIRAACTSGVLKHVRMSGRTIRIKTEWLDEWLQRNTEGGLVTTGQ